MKAWQQFLLQFLFLNMIQKHNITSYMQINSFNHKGRYIHLNICITLCLAQLKVWNNPSWLVPEMDLCRRVLERPWWLAVESLEQGCFGPWSPAIQPYGGGIQMCWEFTFGFEAAQTLSVTQTLLTGSKMACVGQDICKTKPLPYHDNKYHCTTVGMDSGRVIYCSCLICDACGFEVIAYTWFKSLNSKK